jgi:hypothetical protein
MRAAEQSLQRPFDRVWSQWRLQTIGAVILVAGLARLWMIRHYPEPDGDAKGHLGIAAALLVHPLNVAIHWVWPPGYHYLLAALLGVGVTANGVRYVNCALAVLVPLLVWEYGERTLEPSASEAVRLAPFLAGLLCAAMPVVNLLGTSAEPGTLFTILVLLTAWSIDTERFALGGGLLATAAMIRYEAWGAIGVLVGLRAIGFVPPIVRRVPVALSRACRMPLVLIVVPLASVGAWFLAHRIADGTWFGFLRELYRYSCVQRETIHQDILWFPVMQPYYLFGLSLPLFFIGLRRAWRVGFVVPLGIYIFLLVSFASKGTLGSARYYESLTPFVCVGAAYGASMLGELWRPAQPLTFMAAFAHVVRLLAQLGNWTYHLGRR